MRRFLLGEKTEVQAWTNPYITDGLVAMWDGEWNVGGGAHTETMTEWTDIVSGRVADVRGTARVGGKFVSLGGAQFGHCFCSDVSGLPTQGGSIEIAYMLRATTSGLMFSSSELRFGIGPYSNNIVIGSYSRPVVSGKVLNQIQTLTAMQYPSTECYANGVQATMGGNDNWGAGTGMTFPGRYGATTVAGASEVDFYCIRIYSRALTAAEIAANYAIDQRRFGL